MEKLDHKLPPLLSVKQVFQLIFFVLFIKFSIGKARFTILRFVTDYRRTNEDIFSLYFTIPIYALTNSFAEHEAACSNRSFPFVSSASTSETFKKATIVACCREQWSVKRCK